MKYLITLIIICISLLNLKAQTNLVPNGDFENLLACPDHKTSNVYLLTDTLNFPFFDNWFSATGCIVEIVSKKCDTTFVLNVFSPWVTYLNKTVKMRSGINCVSLQPIVRNNKFDSTPSHGGCSENISTILKENLKADHKYKIEYYIKPTSFSLYMFDTNSWLGVRNTSYTNTSALGFCFVNRFLDGSNCMHSYFDGSINYPSLKNLNRCNLNKPLNDTVNWTKISFIYQAKGDEGQLIIGNFENLFTQPLFPFKSDTSAYPVLVPYINSTTNYLVDDVSVIDITNFITGKANTCLQSQDSFSTSIPFASYLWNNGDTNRNTMYINTEKIWCTITEGCDTYTDTFYRKIDYPLPNYFLMSDTTICSDVSLELKLPISEYSSWNLQNNIEQINRPTKVIASISNPCGTSTDTLIIDVKPCNVYMPNAFSPNGDNINDEIKPIGNDFELVTYKVFNRYGEEIFSSNNLLKSWDGFQKGYQCAMGSYFYLIRYKKNNSSEIKTQSGSIELIK